MCGRFVQAVEKKKLEQRFDVPVPEQAVLTPRYNLAPGQGAAVITAGERSPRLEFCVWGLVPSWTKDVRTGYKMINARVETLWEKASFKNPLRYRRCLVPANGFYEWRKEPGTTRKVPMYFTVQDAPLFSFAGLWEVWNDRDGGELYSFTLITRSANSFMKQVHHRMPLILREEQEADWLNHALYRPNDLRDILAGGADIALKAYPVSTRVNHVVNDDPECIRPVLEQGDLL